ncbi:MAG: DUF4329 domain-containing protein [Pseudomonadota bacterium]
MNLYAYAGNDPVNATNPMGVTMSTPTGPGCGAPICVNTNDAPSSPCTNFTGYGWWWCGGSGSAFGGPSPSAGIGGSSGVAPSGPAPLLEREPITLEKPRLCTKGQASPVEFSGDFKEIAATAFEALSKINAQSIRQNIEFGGLVFRTTGRFRRVGATGAVTNNGVDSVKTFDAISQVPAGATVVATFHTHGSGAGFEGSSRTDKQFNLDRNIPGFIGTPGGNFLVNFPGLKVDTDLSGSFGCLPTQ